MLNTDNIILNLQTGGKVIRVRRYPTSPQQ